MKLAIFGATGSVGRLAVNQALEQGHTVTALVRDPGKIEIRPEGLRLIKGDVMNAAAVGQAVQDQDAVLCILGAGRKGKVRSEGTRQIIEAMKQARVKRLICQSSLGVGDSRGNLNFVWKYIMFGLLLRPAYADHVLQEEYVMKSGLDWTIIRPAAFTDGPRTGVYQHGFTGAAEGLTLKISRADVADFLIKQLSDNTYLHKTPGLSY
ncbi:MAG: SDR family oxidoreductase [Pyrinomonadaceae bacterium]